MSLLYRLETPAEFRHNYKRQTEIDTHSVGIAIALVVRCGLDSVEIVRYLGGENTGA